MSAARQAAEYADRVLALIPELAHQAVEERRTNACWYELRARHRLTTCILLMRPFWRWQVRKHGAGCAANKQLANECAMARARVRMEEPA